MRDFAVVSDSLNINTITEYYNTGHTCVPFDYFNAFVGNITILHAHDLKIIPFAFTDTLEQQGAIVLCSCVKATFCGCYVFARQ